MCLKWNLSFDVGSITSTMKGVSEKMKYLEFFEYSPEDLDKLIDKNVKLGELRKNNPGKYPEHLFPSHHIAGQTKGFTVIEATSEQIANGVVYWYPELKLKFMPIIETTKFIEQYLKSK